MPGGVNGSQSNPVTEYLSYPKNGKFNLDAGSTCNSTPVPRTRTSAPA